MNLEVLMTLALIMFFRGDLVYRAEQFVKESYESVTGKLSEAQRKIFDYFSAHHLEILAEFSELLDRSLTPEAKAIIRDVLVPSAAFQTEKQINFETLKKYLERDIRTTPQIAETVSKVKDLFKSYYLDYKKIDVDAAEHEYDKATYQVALLEFFVMQMMNKLTELSQSTTEEDQRLYESVKSSLLAVLQNVENQWPEKKSFGRCAVRNKLIQSVTKEIRHLITHCDAEHNNLSLSDYLRDADVKLYSLQQAFSNFMLRATNTELLKSLDSREIYLCDLANGSVGERYWPGFFSGWEQKDLDKKSPLNQLISYYSQTAQIQNDSSCSEMAERYPGSLYHEYNASINHEKAMYAFAPQQIKSSSKMSSVFNATSRVLGGMYLLRLLNNDLRAALTRQGEKSLVISGQASFQCALIKATEEYVKQNMDNLTHKTAYFKELKERLNPRFIKGLEVALKDTTQKGVEQRPQWSGEFNLEGLPQASNVAVSSWWHKCYEVLNAVGHELNKIGLYVQSRFQSKEKETLDTLTVFDINLAIILVNNKQLRQHLNDTLVAHSKTQLLKFMSTLRELREQFSQTRQQLANYNSTALKDELNANPQLWHFLCKERDGVFLQFNRLRSHQDFFRLKSEISGIIKILANKKSSGALRNAISSFEALQVTVDQIAVLPALSGYSNIRPLPRRVSNDSLYAADDELLELDVEAVTVNLFKSVYKALYDTSGWFKQSVWLTSPGLFEELTLAQLERHCQNNPLSRSQQAHQVVSSLMQTLGNNEDDLLSIQQGNFAAVSAENKAHIFNEVHQKSYSSTLFGRTHLQSNADFQTIAQHAQDESHARSHAIYNAFNFGPA